jgi:hypothetical protein
VRVGSGGVGRGGSAGTELQLQGACSGARVHCKATAANRNVLCASDSQREGFE